MEKYEFRTKQPLWVWIPISFILIFATVYVGMTKKYELGIMWLIYAIITFLAGHFTYTITPNSFIYKPDGLSEGLRVYAVCLLPDGKPCASVAPGGQGATFSNL